MYKFKSFIDINKIKQYFLSYNLNDVHILEKNLDYIDWNGLSKNILENNLDKIKWSYLSYNFNAIHILGMFISCLFISNEKFLIKK